MSFVYLASPYSHKLESVRDLRAGLVTDMAIQITKEGVPVYSPIMMWHEPAVGLQHNGHDFSKGSDSLNWWFSDQAFITACDEFWLALIDGWESSEGMRREMELAIKLGKEIRHVALQDIPHAAAEYKKMRLSRAT